MKAKYLAVELDTMADGNAIRSELAKVSWACTSVDNSRKRICISIDTAGFSCPQMHSGETENCSTIFCCAAYEPHLDAKHLDRWKG